MIFKTLNIRVVPPFFSPFVIISNQLYGADCLIVTELELQMNYWVKIAVFLIKRTATRHIIITSSISALKVGLFALVFLFI